MLLLDVHRQAKQITGREPLSGIIRSSFSLATAARMHGRRRGRKGKVRASEPGIKSCFESQCLRRCRRRRCIIDCLSASFPARLYFSTVSRDPVLHFSLLLLLLSHTRSARTSESEMGERQRVLAASITSTSTRKLENMMFRKRRLRE